MSAAITRTASKSTVGARGGLSDAEGRDVDGSRQKVVGATIVFLAGPGATFITGETFMVNGGYGLRP